MKILFNNTNFKSRENTYFVNNHKFTEYFNDNNVLEKKLEFDEFGRDVDAKRFSLNGKILSHQHKDYFETATERGLIETYKDDSQEYIRKVYTKFENGFKHVVDDYKSKTSPKNNYINECIYNMQNKLSKIITNGKIISL